MESSFSFSNHESLVIHCLHNLLNLRWNQIVLNCVVILDHYQDWGIIVAKARAADAVIITFTKSTNWELVQPLVNCRNQEAIHPHWPILLYFIAQTLHMRSIIPSEKLAPGLLQVHLRQLASHLASNLCFILAIVIENPSSEVVIATFTITNSNAVVNSCAKNYLTWCQKFRMGINNLGSLTRVTLRWQVP